MLNLLVWHFNVLDQLDSDRVGQYLILKVGVWNVMQSWKKIFFGFHDGFHWIHGIKKKEQKSKSWDHILLTKFVVHSCFFIIVFWDIGIKIKPRGLQLLKAIANGLQAHQRQIDKWVWNLHNHGNENWALLDQEIHQLG